MERLCSLNFLGGFYYGVAQFRVAREIFFILFKSTWERKKIHHKRKSHSLHVQIFSYLRHEKRNEKISEKPEKPKSCTKQKAQKSTNLNHMFCGSRRFRWCCIISSHLEAVSSRQKFCIIKLHNKLILVFNVIRTASCAYIVTRRNRLTQHARFTLARVSTRTRIASSFPSLNFSLPFLSSVSFWRFNYHHRSHINIASFNDRVCSKFVENWVTSFRLANRIWIDKKIAQLQFNDVTFRACLWVTS